VESLPSKRRILKKKEEKKKREQGLKSKRGETSYKEAPCFKRKKGR
jgi:heme exporter protein D